MTLRGVNLLPGECPKQLMARGLFNPLQTKSLGDHLSLTTCLVVYSCFVSTVAWILIQHLQSKVVSLIDY